MAASDVTMTRAQFNGTLGPLVQAERELDAFIGLMADLRHHPIQAHLRPIAQKLYEARLALNEAEGREVQP
jgi:hypothetical protein